MTETPAAAVPPAHAPADRDDPARRLEELIARVEAERAELARLRTEAEAERDELASLRDELAAQARSGTSGAAPSPDPAPAPRPLPGANGPDENAAAVPPPPAAEPPDGQARVENPAADDGPAEPAPPADRWALPSWAPVAAVSAPAPARRTSSLLSAFGLEDPAESGGESEPDVRKSSPGADEDRERPAQPAAGGELRSVLADLFEYDADRPPGDGDGSGQDDRPGETSPDGFDAGEDFADEGEPADTGDAAPVDAAEPDSVAAYMENLLARMRQAQPGGDPSRRTPAPPKPAPPKAAANPAAPQPGPKPATPPPSAAVPRPVEHSPSPACDEPPRPVRRKVDKEELRRSMDHLRSIANTSARTAVAESSWRKLRGRLTLDVIFAVVLLAVALVLFSTDVYGRMLHLSAGGAVGLGAMWLARDAGAIMRKIHRGRTAKREAARRCAASTGT